MKLMSKMVILFLITAFISLIGFGFVIYASISAKNDAQRVHEEEMPRLLLTTKLNENNLKQTINLRGYLLTRDPKFMEKYQKALEDSARTEKELLAMARTEEGKKHIQEVISHRLKYSNVVNNEIIPAFQAGKTEELVLAIAKGSNHTSDATERGEALEKRYSGLAAEAILNAVASADETINVAIIVAVISLILSIIIAVLSARAISTKINQLAELAKKLASGDLTSSYSGGIGKDEIGDLALSLNEMVHNLKEIVKTIDADSQTLVASSQQLTASADQSAEASQQIAGSINEVSNGTDKQIASVQATSGIVENIVAELEEVSSNISLIADKTVKTAQLATTGGKSADKAILQMNEMEKTVSASANVVKQLGERSKEIGQIIDTITGIAGQTNLLALNAAIEAARAGEQGRGFAVVAEEVRKLAEQSQDASKKIATLIGEIQGETAQAVEAMETGTKEVKIGAEVVNETGLSFKEIIDLINQASGQIKDISKVVYAVAQESEKIVESVEYINNLNNVATGEIHMVSAATEEQSASMEEIAAAAQSLSNLAVNMQTTVEKFRI